MSKQQPKIRTYPLIPHNGTLHPSSDDFAQSPIRDYTVEAVAMPNAETDEETGVPKGVAYLLSPETPAKVLLDSLEGDWFAGVSMYPILEFPESAIGREHPYLLEKFQKLNSTRPADLPFYDYSVLGRVKGSAGESSSADKEENRIKSLGAQDCFFAVMEKTTAHHGSGDKWCILVRSYSQFWVDRMTDIVSSDEDMTVAALWKSDVVQNMEIHSAVSRSVLAAAVARFLGVVVDTRRGSVEPSARAEMARSTVENFYNVFSPRRGGRDGFVFYDRCYDLTSCRGGVILFQNNMQNVKILRTHRSDVPWNNKAGLDAFPMSYPARYPEADAGRGLHLKHDAGSVYWGGELFLHPKHLPERQFHFKESRQWAQLIEDMGYDHKDGSDEYKIVASYVSTENEKSIPLATIIQYSPKDAVITISGSHVSIVEYFKNFDRARALKPDLSGADLVTDATDEIGIKYGWVIVPVSKLKMLHEVLQTIKE